MRPRRWPHRFLVSNAEDKWRRTPTWGGGRSGLLVVHHEKNLAGRFGNLHNCRSAQTCRARRTSTINSSFNRPYVSVERGFEWSFADDLFFAVTGINTASPTFTAVSALGTKPAFGLTEGSRGICEFAVRPTARSEIARMRRFIGATPCVRS